MLERGKDAVRPHRPALIGNAVQDARVLPTTNLIDGLAPEWLVEKLQIRAALFQRAQPWPFAAQIFLSNGLERVGLGGALGLARLALGGGWGTAGFRLPQWPHGGIAGGCKRQRRVGVVGTAASSPTLR